MRYNKIRKMDISNGEGIRVSLFVQGCHFHCKNCFNQETWDFKGGKQFTTETLDTLLKLCDNQQIKGLSILGGEPLCNENFKEVIRICKEYKNKFNKDLWLWTGYEFEDIFNDSNKKNILQYLDYIICGKFIEEKKDLRLQWCGSSNQRVIDVQKSLKENKIILYE